MRVGLALGAGGPLGWAFHLGVLDGCRAVGHDPSSVDRIVGTSAGAAVASSMLAGADTETVLTAVTTGMSGLGLGGDLAGSLRVPAHFTGVYSHKPSFGLIPMDGHFSRTVLPPAPQPPGSIFGVLGPIARSVEDLELAMEVLAALQKTIRS